MVLKISEFKFVALLYVASSNDPYLANHLNVGPKTFPKLAVYIKSQKNIFKNHRAKGKHSEKYNKNAAGVGNSTTLAF